MHRLEPVQLGLELRAQPFLELVAGLLQVVVQLLGVNMHVQPVHHLPRYGNFMPLYYSDGAVHGADTSLRTSVNIVFSLPCSEFLSSSSRSSNICAN